MSRLSISMTVMRSLATFHKGGAVDLDELESQIIDFQRECLAGSAAVGGLLASVDFNDKGVDPSVLENVGFLHATLSELAYEATNWLDDVSEARNSGRVHPAEGIQHADR